MGMKRLSAVVTSAGIATAIGLSEESTWRSLLTGKSGVAPLNAYEYRGMKLPVGCCNLDSVKSHLESRGIPFAEKEQRAVLLAFYVISKALEKKEAPKTGEKRGLYVGSSLTTNEYLARGYENCFAGRRNPASAIMDGANCYFSSRISQVFGFRDSCVTISSSCASGLQCIGFAMRDLELGMVDEAVVVGVDSALIKALLDTWMSARILSKIDPAETASRPFCNTRRGFVYAEGAGCIVLRRKDSDPLLKITGVDFNCGPDKFVRRDTGGSDPVHERGSQQCRRVSRRDRLCACERQRIQAGGPRGGQGTECGVWKRDPRLCLEVPVRE